MPYSVTITPSYQPYFLPNVTHQFRLRLEVTAAEGLSPKVFRYRYTTAAPGDSLGDVYCDGVCSAVDLAEFPEDDPVPGAFPGYFRLGFVEMDFRGQDEALEARDAFFAEIRALLRSLRAADTLSVGDPITIEP